MRFFFLYFLSFHERKRLFRQKIFELFQANALKEPLWWLYKMNVKQLCSMSELFFSFVDFNACDK